MTEVVTGSIARSDLESMIEKLSNQFQLRSAHIDSFREDISRLLQTKNYHIDELSNHSDLEKEKKMDDLFVRASQIDPKLTRQEFEHLLDPTTYVPELEEEKRHIPLAEKIKTWFSGPKNNQKDVGYTSLPVLRETLIRRFSKSALYIDMLVVDDMHLKEQIAHLLHDYVKEGKTEIISAPDYAYLQLLEKKEEECDRKQRAVSLLADSLEEIDEMHHTHPLEYRLLQAAEEEVNQLRAAGLPSNRKQMLSEKVLLNEYYTTCLENGMPLERIEKSLLYIPSNQIKKVMDILPIGNMRQKEVLKNMFEIYQIDSVLDCSLILVFITVKLAPLNIPQTAIDGRNARLNRCLSYATESQLSVIQKQCVQKGKDLNDFCQFDWDPKDGRLLIANGTTKYKYFGSYGMTRSSSYYFANENGSLKETIIRSLEQKGINGSVYIPDAKLWKHWNRDFIASFLGIRGKKFRTPSWGIDGDYDDGYKEGYFLVNFRKDGELSTRVPGRRGRADLPLLVRYDPGANSSL